MAQKKGQTAQAKAQLNKVQQGNVKKQTNEPQSVQKKQVQANVTKVVAKGAKMPQTQVKANVAKVVPTAATASPQKQIKTPAKRVPPKKVVEVKEEDLEDEDAGEAGEEEYDETELLGEEEEGAEAEEDDEEQDDSDEQNGVEFVGDEDNEAPDEVPTVKNNVQAKSAKNVTPRIPNGKIPRDMPDEQVVFIKNLPSKFKQTDIVQVFAKYGHIHTTSCRQAENGGTALVAYYNAESAQAALEANDTAQIKGQTIQVSLSKSKERQQQRLEEIQKVFEERKQHNELTKDRTVYVKNLKNKTTEEQIREQFGKYGNIEEVRPTNRGSLKFAYVVYEDEDAAAAAAKELHNSILNGVTIAVYHKQDTKDSKIKDSDHTILIKNSQNLATLAGDQLKSIFEKCGEIVSIDILCMRRVLAFVTFKDEDSAKEALKLDGTTVDNLQLDIEKYRLPNEKLNTSIFVQNVRPGVNEAELYELFQSCGPIEKITIRPGHAIVQFKDTDGFCKSFLKNETYMRGQMIFLEPFSEKKLPTLKRKKPNFKHTMASFKRGGHKKFKQN